MAFKDIKYTVRDSVATITINRPEVHNAFRGQTCEELVDAFNKAAWNDDIGVIVLTGAGKKAFSSGGDQGAHDGVYDGRGTIGLPIEELHSIMRDAPKPVIAKVRGWCIGGGNVLATICDLTVAGESAVFGQAGPKMGSVDPGFGTNLLARHVGQKKAKEIWFLCRRYTAHEAMEMGLVNAVVPDARLDGEVRRWCDEILQMSPTAIALGKRAFNAETESIRGLSNLGNIAVRLYYDSPEGREGERAFRAKRKPQFRKAAAAKKKR
ncbi:MAG: enoyl-CoA hydratase-related protein [Proteobacteria bacterium]|nr:enoyl-CoA hydratase-related protein [Pseudomonadota bacterium]MDA1058847.1 enoyl-CoA hydratase-related protein [Pseudomonadota bacterium]